MRIASAAAVVAGATLLLVGLLDSEGNGSGPPEARTPAGEPAPLPRPAPPAEPARGPRNPPVVLLVLDEFPPDVLLRADGSIDATRYPNFARLSNETYWFPNASTVYDATTRATPAILDGLIPRDGTTPAAADHPNSIYTMLGRRGYRVVNGEEATQVCPERLCPGNSRRDLDVLGSLAGGRAQRLHRFIASVRARRRALYVKHALIPHGPWIFLPSGRQHRFQSRDPVPGLAGERGFHDPDLLQVSMLRHMLQVGYTDRELGRLRRTMERRGIWNRALVVVTADHGFAFQSGVPSRRRTNDSNIHMIAPVPLFIKAPGQQRGRTIRSYVRTVDIVPTIADILNIRPGYRVEGRSAFSRATRRRRHVRVIDREFLGAYRISARALERRRRAFLRRKLRLFGEGPERGPDWRLYRGVGPHRELLGRPVSELTLAAAGGTRARIARAGQLASVKLGSKLRPVHIAGTILGEGVKRDIAVAVNGRIEAVSRTFFLQRRSGETFAVVVPEWVLREGRNDVRVFEVRGDPGQLRLIPLG